MLQAFLKKRTAVSENPLQNGSRDSAISGFKENVWMGGHCHYSWK
jgi:hypothetical protein